MLLQLPRVVDVGNPVNVKAPLNRNLFAWWVNLPGINRSAYAHATTYNTTPVVYDICERAGGGTCTGLSAVTGLTRPSGYRSWKTNGKSYASTSLKRAYPSGASGMTFSFWARPSSLSASYFSNLSDSVNSFAVILGFQAGKWNLFEGSYASGGSTEITATQDAWQHVIFTRDSARVQGYLNGVQKCDVTHSWGSLPAVTGINIGQSLSSGSNPYNGYYDDVRLYNRRLTPNDAWNLYRASTGGYARELNWLDRPFVLSTPPLTHYTLTADAGSYTLTGQDAGLHVGRAITAEAGTFTITGIDAGLTATRTISADVGAFTITGIDAGLSLGYVMAADAGAFALTGIDAGLTATRLITADAGAFVLTGNDANLNFGYVMTAAAGSFTLTGIDAGLTATRLLTAGTGTFTLTGIDATLTYYVPPAPVEDLAGPGSSGIGPYGSKLRNPLTKMFKK